MKFKTHRILNRCIDARIKFKIEEIEKWEKENDGKNLRMIEALDYAELYDTLSILQELKSARKKLKI